MQWEHTKGSTPTYPGISDGFTEETYKGKKKYGIFSDQVAKKGNIERVMWDEPGKALYIRQRSYKSVCYKVKTSYFIKKRKKMILFTF